MERAGAGGWGRGGCGRRRRRRLLRGALVRVRRRRRRRRKARRRRTRATGAAVAVERNRRRRWWSATSGRALVRRVHRAGGRPVHGSSQMLVCGRPDGARGEPGSDRPRTAVGRRRRRVLDALPDELTVLLGQDGRTRPERTVVLGIGRGAAAQRTARARARARALPPRSWRRRRRPPALVRRGARAVAV